MAANDLILELFGRGLGELLVLHARKDEVYLGNVVLEKGRLVIKDQGLLPGFKPAQLEPCREEGILGMITVSQNKVWESITFNGLQRCDLPVDLGKTRHGALTAAANQYGESLIDFVGSVYRGYQLMLDHHFLPVVMLWEIRTREGQRGLAVCDLRVVPMDLGIIRKINDVVRKSVEKQLILEVQDLEVVSEEFDRLFPDHVSVQQAGGVSGSGKPPPPISGGKANASPVQQEISAGAGMTQGADLIVPVLQLLRLVAAEIGEARAFGLFEKWAEEFVTAQVRGMLERQHINQATPRRFYDAMKSHFERFGEQYVIVEETPDRIVHEIHGCLYRQACLRVGGINMEKWGTCTQVIPTVRNKAATLVDPGLEWVWNRCDRRSGQPCLYEIHRRIQAG